MNGGIAGEGEGWTVIYGSSWTFHKTIVPPQALVFFNGKSRSNLSVEFKEKPYLISRKLMHRSTSDEKI